jgi:hypothetical protein
VLLKELQVKQVDVGDRLLSQKQPDRLIIVQGVSGRNS